MNIYAKIKIAAGSVIILAFALLCGLNAIPRLDAIAGDMLLKSGGQAAPEIVILAIDDSSIDMLGRFPWPRSTYAALIGNLMEGGAAVIALDILFTEQSSEDEDYALMEAMAEAGNVVLPVQADIADSSGGKGQASRIGADGLLAAYSVLYPIPALAAQAADMGHINALPDDWDGFIRRGMGSFRDAGSGEVLRSWDEAVYEQYCLATGSELKKAPSDAFLMRPYIYFTGPPGSIARYPFFAALDPDIIDPAEFAGKIVLVGAYASGLDQDAFPTPASGAQRMYGVEIHANIISNMLAGAYVNPAPAWLNLSLLALLCGASVAGYFRLRRTLAKLGLFIGAVTVLIGCWLLLFFAGQLASIAYVLLALLLLYLADVIVSYTQEFAEKRRITTMFGRYLAPQVLGKVVREGESSLQLGGEERELTVLFVDIRGFTTFSEVLSPAQVVEILNEYLTLATNAVFEFGGTLDKYVGDAVMALYNVPYDQDHHALRAVKSALQMQRNGVALNAQLEERFGRSVQFGVGVNTGRAVVGNIGSPVRMDYTAIGDMVNVAARLESNAKAGQILISGAVYNQVKEEVEASPLGELKVKGRENKVHTYLVQGLKEES